MPLLHVHSGNLYGGVETMLVTLSRFRAATPLEQEFALCFDQRLADELRAQGALVHLLGEVRARRPGTIIRARERLRELLRERAFEAVACHMPWAQAIFGPIVRAARVPLIFWMHDLARGRHWLERWAAWTAPDLAICNSAHTASTLPNLYPRARHEVLCPPVALDLPPLDEPARTALRTSLETPRDAVVIVQASRFEPWKGHRDHLEALGRLASLPGWFCWIVGGTQRAAEERYLEDLERRAAELGLRDRIRFCGHRPDVPRLLRAADIYCQPNTAAEPFGIVFAEALAAGLPVVTTGLGGASELVDASCGLMARPNDPAAVADALRRLVSDRELRVRLAGNGIRRAQELCSPLKQLNRLGSIVERVGPSQTSARDRMSRRSVVRSGNGRCGSRPGPRVLHIAPAIFGDGDEFFGGAERYVYELAYAMSRVVPTALVTFGAKALKRQDEALQVRVIRNWIHYRRFRFDPFSPALLPEVAQADVVHYHQTNTIMSGIAALAGHFFNKPVFTTDAGAGGYGLHRFIDMRDRYAGHLHLSNFSRRHFGHEELPTAKVIYGGVNPERFCPDPQLSRSQEALFVGRLLPHKGIDFLIEAAQNDIAVRIVGRPFRHAAAYRERLLRLAEGKQISFDTRCADGDLIKAYRTALCIVLPSVYASSDGQRHPIPELLGLTLLEGMACGTPAICTNVASLPEIVEDGISGFVVPPGDPVALRERILWLRAHPAAAERMGAAARQRVLERFTWDVAVRACLAAYATTLQG